MSDASYKSRQSGFTLIEILVVLTIFIFIAGSAMFVSMDSYRGFSLRGERDTVISVLQKARSQSISNICLGACSANDGQKHGVHFDIAGKKYVIFQTTNNFTSGRDASVDQEVPISGGGINFTPGTLSDIIFDQLTGQAKDQTGAACVPTSCFVTLTQGTNHDTIQINSEGQIDNP